MEGFWPSWCCVYWPHKRVGWHKLAAEEKTRHTARNPVCECAGTRVCVCVFVGEASMLEALWAVLSGLHAARYVKPRPMMVLGHNGGRASNNEQ